MTKQFTKEEQSYIWDKVRHDYKNQKQLHNRLDFKELYSTKMHNILFQHWTKEYQERINENETKILKKKNLTSYTPELPEMVISFC